MQVTDVESKTSRKAASPAPPTGSKDKPSSQEQGRILAAAQRRVRRIWEGIDRKLMRMASRSGRWSSFYYAFFDRSFDREHRAVLAGRLAFEQSRSGKVTTSSLLRRNTHRLEKGLLSRPRRAVFALDYIEETLAFYESIVKTPPEQRIVSEGELRWAQDVLTEYFKVTGSHPRLDPLRARFNQLPRPVPVQEDGCRWIPYRRDLSVPPSVSYEDLLTLAWRRRSVRWFQPRPVPRELVEKALAVATLSPSACNRQPFQFRVFDDPALVREVSKLPGGTAGFDHQFPMIIVIVGELRNYYGERDRHLIYIDASLAAMSFVLAAETLGLGTCCINWPDIEEFEEKAARVLRLEPDQRPIMFMAVGYPDPEGMVAYSQKKPNTQLCRYNFEG